MSIVKLNNLSYKNDTSDKVYSLILSEDTSTVSRSYSVAFAYGRRGSNLKTGFKIQQATKSEAESVYKDILDEKVDKGYEVDASVDFSDGDFVNKTINNDQLLDTFNKNGMIIAVNYKDSDHEVERVYIDTSKLNPVNPLDNLILQKSKGKSKSFNIDYFAYGWDGDDNPVGKTWVEIFKQDDNLCGPHWSSKAELKKKPPVVHKILNLHIRYE
jgi:predicted DNA-binding WGR domain protein